jgi:glycosyltransferase involved in cell wall biosynthesis
LSSIFVSIVIPVFDASAYLEDCIQSILQQSLKEIEIIIVNDGSSDNSKFIIEEFAGKDNRIVFIDGPNEGVSAARNKGVKIAKGEFIGFVDADDWVEPGMYEKMYREAIAQGADWAICNVLVDSAGHPSHVRLELTNETISLNQRRDSEIRAVMRFKYDYANWNKIYSREIVQQNHLLFEEGMRVGEDLLFNCCYIQYSFVMCIINEPFYHYMVHPDSVMSIDKHDEIEEYNKLYIGYHSYCKRQQLKNRLAGFDAEMRRGFYYAVIPRIVSKIRKSEKKWVNRMAKYAQSLKFADKAFFEYTSEELGSGIQRIKKFMLKKGYFRCVCFWEFIVN